MQTKNNNQQQPAVEKLNDEEDTMDRPSLPPRRTPVVLPHQRYEAEEPAPDYQVSRETATSSSSGTRSQA